MLSPFTLARISFPVGALVVCHDAKGFLGNEFGARIVDGAEMHRPAREGFVWVKEVGLSVDPSEAWVTEWPKSKIS